MENSASNNGTANNSNSTDSSEDSCKLFVGGLAWTTTKEDVQEYFERFGTVSDVIVAMNAITNQSRGFGFVTFVEPVASQRAVNSAPPHVISGKEVDVKQYSTKVHEIKRRQKLDNSMKIFVGGIPPGMTDEEIVGAFSKFGTVVDFNNMMDETRTRSRGFGFLTFEKQESIQRAITEHWVTINGKQLEVKPAQFNNKKPIAQQDQSGYNAYGGAGMYGGGYSSAQPGYYDYGGEEDYYGANQAWNYGVAGYGGAGYGQWRPRAPYDPTGGMRGSPRSGGPAMRPQRMVRPGGRRSPPAAGTPYKRPRPEYPDPSAATYARPAVPAAIYGSPRMPTVGYVANPYEYWAQQ